MKPKVFLTIAINIITVFTCGMLMTFVTESLRDFFGDTPCNHLYPHSTSMDIEWDWGSRHYFYFWMMVFLFILSIINAVVSIRNILKKHYPNFL
jgi:hypothetical protein